MNLNHLFKLQEIMENKIKNSTDIPEDILGKENVFDLKFLAFQVKLGQLANETKCYKYQKVIDDIPKEKLIIRYIDAMQFLLSIGNEYHFNIINEEIFDNVVKPEGLIKGFSQIFSDVTKLKEIISLGDFINALNIYIELFAKFIGIGYELGLTFDEVYLYYSKNYEE